MNILKDSKKRAELLKALAHPTRLCIVKGLIDNQCNVSAMADCLDIAQPTISQHLRVLKGAGIVRGEREGHEIRYCVIDETAKKIINVLW